VCRARPWQIRRARQLGVEFQVRAPRQHQRVAVAVIVIEPACQSFAIGDGEDKSSARRRCQQTEGLVVYAIIGPPPSSRLSNLDWTRAAHFEKPRKLGKA